MSEDIKLVCGLLIIPLGVSLYCLSVMIESLRQARKERLRNQVRWVYQADAKERWQEQNPLKARFVCSKYEI